MIILLTLLGLTLAALLIGYFTGVHTCRTTDLLDLFDRGESYECSGAAY
jgi:hypothetical protein